MENKFNIVQVEVMRFGNCS